MRTDTFVSDFVAALTEQIERLVDGLPPAATTYRGADLRHALQRALYFHIANDEECRRWWHATRPTQRWLVERMTSELLARRARALALAAPRMVRDAALARRFRQLGSRDANRPLDGRLAVSIIHAKFARYTESIGLPPGAHRYYCGTLQSLHAELARAGIDATLSPALSSWRRLADRRQPYLELYGLQRELDAHLGFLQRARPRAVVVVEGNAPSDEVMNQACKRMGIPCVCIQQGWSPIVHAGFRRFAFTKMLVWGEGFARILARYSPNQRFVATGSHVIGSPSAERPNAGGRNAISFFLQGRSPMIDDDAWKGFIALVRRVATGRAGDALLVREHPSAPVDPSTRQALRALPNVTLIDPGAMPLQEQLARSRVGVSLFSTTLFECIASAVVPVAVNPGILREIVPSFAAAGAGIEASSWTDAETAIARLCSDDAFYDEHVAHGEEFAREYFSGADPEQAKIALRRELGNV